MKLATGTTTCGDKAHSGVAGKVQIFFADNDMNHERTAGRSLTVAAMTGLGYQRFATNFVANLTARTLPCQ